MALALSSVPRITKQQATRQELHIVGLWTQHDLVQGKAFASSIKKKPHFEEITPYSKKLGGMAKTKTIKSTNTRGLKRVQSTYLTEKALGPP